MQKTKQSLKERRRFMRVLVPYPHRMLDKFPFDYRLWVASCMFAFSINKKNKGEKYARLHVKFKKVNRKLKDLDRVFNF